MWWLFWFKIVYLWQVMFFQKILIVSVGVQWLTELSTIFNSLPMYFPMRDIRRIWICLKRKNTSGFSTSLIIVKLNIWWFPRVLGSVLLWGLFFYFLMFENTLLSKQGLYKRIKKRMNAFEMWTSIRIEKIRWRQKKKHAMKSIEGSSRYSLSFTYVNLNIKI